MVCVFICRAETASFSPEVQSLQRLKLCVPVRGGGHGVLGIGEQGKQRIKTIQLLLKENILLIEILISLKISLTQSVV